MTLRVEGHQLLTDQWVLRIHGEFVLRDGFEPKLIECSHCLGHGHFGGGPLGGEPEDCGWCCGTGRQTDASHITERRPEMPVELIAHMRDAFQDYLRQKAQIDLEDEQNPVTPI